MQLDLIELMNSDKPGGPEFAAGGKLTGQKPALKMKEVWAIRTRLEMDGDERSLALFNLAIDSKLRGCDLVRIRVSDVAAGGEVKSRGAIIQKKTGRPPRHRIVQNGWAKFAKSGRSVVFVEWQQCPKTTILPKLNSLLIERKC